jgi:hypothetical protein
MFDAQTSALASGSVCAPHAVSGAHAGHIPSFSPYYLPPSSCSAIVPTSVLSACPAKPWRSGVPSRPILPPLLAVLRFRIGKVMQGKASVFDPPRGVPRFIPFMHRPVDSKAFILGHIIQFSTLQFISFFTPKNLRFMACWPEALKSQNDMKKAGHKLHERCKGSVGFQARRSCEPGASADLEIGDTAGLETCATSCRQNKPESGSLRPKSNQNQTDSNQKKILFFPRFSGQEVKMMERETT